MRSILTAACTLFSLCAFIQPMESAHKHATPSPFMKGCLVKSSRFDRWVGKTITKLNSNSSIVNTTAGPIQYSWHGRGPVILSIHGGFGGYDQGLVVADSFVKDGFSILSVSRPGYLGTPLPPLAPNVEFTAAQQADYIVAILDTLNISQVVALGFSAGGPVAFELAKRYPTKVTALVLESIGQQPGDSPVYEMLSGILSQPTLPDFATYLLYQSIQIDYYSVAKFVLAQDTTIMGAALADRTRYVASHSCQYKLLKRLLASTIPVSPRLPGILNDFLGVNYWGGPNFVPAGFTVPTIIVQALDDDSGYYPDAQYVNAQIAGSQLITVQESGHFVWLGERAREWQKQVVEFLKGHIPAGSFKPDSA